MLSPVQTSPTTVIPDVLEAAQTYDIRRLLFLLNQSQTTFGLGTTVDEIVMPSMRLVGRLWESGQADVGEEHVATVATQMWLGQVLANSVPPNRIGTVLLACGPSDLHSLGLECMAALLAERGADCRSLGSAVPTRSVAAAVARVRPVAVVLVSHSLKGRPGAVRTLTAAAQQGVDVYYAGAAFGLEGSRTGVPGCYLGERLSDAADLVVRLSLG
ncbi:MULTISPECIES: B12-binding domain-containing protein [Actinomycetes]|uniref:cobalamin B12-binding domain-containing protein n=1 Tax=Actinomycetes TaxID=1760 RepID=UPI0035C9A9BC